MIPAGAPFAIQSVELDFLTLIESGMIPPIAFRTKSALQTWAGSHSLMERRIGRRSPRNIIVLSGKVETPNSLRLFYTQVWARANYKDYRNAIASHIRKTENGQCDINEYDVDHAVSRNLLRKYGDEAWVNILLVHRSINRAIGAMMEKVYKLPETDQILINVECLLKLFYKRKGKLRRELLEDYYEEACRNFIPDESGSGHMLSTTALTEILNDIAENSGLKKMSVRFS